MDTLTDIEFPIWGLLPKKETEVVSFLDKYSDYDGRGITIAIFDSGVDPGAPGLQITSEGKQKVIARYDCSGCGDVDTSKIVQPKDGYITGLSGRKLKIPSTWKNPSNDYRIGIKNAFDLYPDKLIERISAERKEKLWDNQHKLALAAANRILQNYDQANANNEDKLEKEDIEAKVEALMNVDKKYVDDGPIYDCVLFHDGEMWRACVDTSEEGNLELCHLLGEYDKTYEYASLTDADQLNFSINVNDDGNVLELVGLCSSHGTHVASIASAYFPDAPDKNGVAPGAQIVSLTIGDGRLRSMETGTALVRAMIKVMELSEKNRIHVINMSYGEHTHWSNSGRIGELMNQVVNKYEVVWIVSAGNHGPALSTIGTPPDISQASLIGVGAYVSPNMMIAEYSLREKMPGMAYTWTSRGPTIDGGFGVTVCAPGGAITSVPNFTLRNSQLMNGTSMAAPHVAGAIALLLSGLEKKNIKYSPYHIKRSLENTADFLSNVDPFAQGSGLLQVDKAFTYLLKYSDLIERDVRFHIMCGANNHKGIHLRGKYLKTSREVTVTVEPFFLDNDLISSKSKINFELKLALSCDASYVQYPSHLDLSNMSRMFSIKIDPMNLEPGAYTSSLNAYDVSCVTKGPVFRVPITVVQPIKPEANVFYHSWNNVPFKPNTMKRHFFIVPEEATWAVIKLRTVQEGTLGRFVVHTMQLLPRQSCRTQESNKNLQVGSNSEVIQGFQVRGGVNLEVVITKYWANLGQVNVDYSIQFYGIKPNVPQIVMQACDGIYNLEVRNLQGEEIVPSISLKHCVQILKPSEYKIISLSKRDVVPPGRQIYSLILTYNFHLNKATQVIPNCPMLSDVLYESEFESQLWMLYDSNKQLWGCGDAYPSKYCIKLEKGDYVIRLCVRHERKDFLEKLTEIFMLINQKLQSPIAMDVYSNYNQAVIAGKKIVVGHLTHDHYLPLYIAPLSSDKFVAKTNNPANYLTGTIVYTKDEIGKKVDVYPIKYILNENANNKKASPKTGEKDKQSKWDEYNEALRDLKHFWLPRLTPDNADLAATLYQELKQAYPDFLTSHVSMLQYMDPMEPKRQLPIFDNKQLYEKNSSLNLDIILSICDIILEAVDQEKLLAYFAIKTDQRPDAAKIKSLMEKQKMVLIEALCRKGIILCKMHLAKDNDAKKDSQKDEAINVLWEALLKFVDVYDIKVSTSLAYFGMWHATLSKQYGRLIKFLQKLQEEKNSIELEKKLAEICKMQEWSHWARLIEKSIPLKFPNAYKPF